jgi:hypothetical protein
LLDLKVRRSVWWLSLALFFGGMIVAFWVHASGLSFWLQRVDWWHTFGAVLIAGVSLGVFVIASRGRMKDMRAPTRLLWLLPAFPVWVLFMGLVPGATETKPDPVRATMRQLGVALLVGSVLAAVLATVAIWLGRSNFQAIDSTREVSDGAAGTNGGSLPSTKPESKSVAMSFDDCLSLIRRTATDLGVAPINIVETDIMRMVRFVASDGTVLVTCSRPDGKAIITKSD